MTFNLTSRIAEVLTLKKGEGLDLDHVVLTSPRNAKIIAHYQGQVDRLGTIVAVDSGDLKGQNRRADRPQNDTVRTVARGQ